MNPPARTGGAVVWKWIGNLFMNQRNHVHQSTQPPTYFPRDFHEYWLAVEHPNAIRQELAALLLADLRVSGPDWAADRYECLRRLLNDLERKPA